MFRHFSNFLAGWKRQYRAGLSHGGVIVLLDIAKEAGVTHVDFSGPTRYWFFDDVVTIEEVIDHVSLRMCPRLYHRNITGKEDWTSFEAMYEVYKNDRRIQRHYLHCRETQKWESGPPYVDIRFYSVTEILPEYVKRDSSK